MIREGPTPGDTSRGAMTESTQDAGAPLRLDLEPRPGGWRRRGVAVAVVVAVGAAAAWLLRPGGEAGDVAYRLAEIERGSLIESVSSTGRLGALGEVELTSQVSGQVLQVLVDFNDPVSAGQVLARLDPEMFEARAAQAQADLAMARANLESDRAAVARAEADVRNAAAAVRSLEAQLETARIDLDAADRELQRQRELFARNVVTAVAVEEAVTRFDQRQAQFDQVRAQLEAQQATLDSRRAALAMARAGIATAEAQVQRSQAQQNVARIELSHTEIRSPVDGTVIARNVEPGRTVSTGASAGPLFTIAQDLRRMQVQVNVDEADIGRIREGQRAAFSVDAYPGREYDGAVRQVRHAAETVQNVVTYTVVVSAANDDLSLLPGMTATARIVLDERSDALRVPNAALRYAPAGFVEGASADAGPPVAVAGRTPGPGVGARGAAGGGPPGGFAPQQLAALDLSEDQQRRLSETMAAARQDAAGLRERGAAPEEIRERIAAAALAVLTPEQRAALQGAAAGQPRAPASTRAVRPARVFVVGADGAPKPVAIRIGLTDGGFTELVAGDLDAGAQVIVGSNGTAPAETPGRFRFFGF